MSKSGKTSGSGTWIPGEVSALIAALAACRTAQDSRGACCMRSGLVCSPRACVRTVLSVWHSGVLVALTRAASTLAASVCHSDVMVALTRAACSLALRICVIQVGFSTSLVHAGVKPCEKTGAILTPIYQVRAHAASRMPCCKMKTRE